MSPPFLSDATRPMPNIRRAQFTLLFNQFSTNMRTPRLEQIEQLGTKTMNELEFVAFLEAGRVKRRAEGDEDEGVVKPSKSKKVKA